jgi:hypothetical protein
MRCRVALRSYIVCVTARVPTPRTTAAPNSPSDTRDALVVERRTFFLSSPYARAHLLLPGFLRALDGCAALSCCSAFRYVDYAAGDDLLGYLLVSEGEVRLRRVFFDIPIPPLSFARGVHRRRSSGCHLSQ